MGWVEWSEGWLGVSGRVRGRKKPGQESAIVIGGHWAPMTCHHHNDHGDEHLHHHRYLRASCSVTIAALHHHHHHHHHHHDSPVEYAGDCYDHHHCHWVKIYQCDTETLLRLVTLLPSKLYLFSSVSLLTLRTQPYVNDDVLAINMIIDQICVLIYDIYDISCCCTTP